MAVEIKPDFQGWATKAGLLCSDGRTIMPNAFEHQDAMQVPLVWQHGHKDPKNVLGHVKLENREEGVYAYGFFNDTAEAKHAKTAVDHKDINSLSIWANELMERSKRVMHGTIREVSLVLSGANPGALIDSVIIKHGDGEQTVLDDEAIIFTGLTMEYADEKTEVVTHAADEDGDETIQDIFKTLSDKQKNMVYYLVGEILTPSEGEVKQSGMNNDGENNNDDDTKEGTDPMGTTGIKHNVFENTDEAGKVLTGAPTLSHDGMKEILSVAAKTGSLKASVEAYAEEHLEHGIQDIELLFPDAKNIGTTPELFGRRVEWVNTLLNALRKSPFARIKTMSADLTVEEARAKGYIKGSLKKEEFFRVSRRLTTPTTIYKKQKLDRDDMIDITDFDVVTWLKGEMRLMLDEELARAVLVGDGRASDNEDKIDEERIRPIATDHELYTTVVTVNIDNANSSFSEVVDAIILNRSKLRGTGQPILFTTEAYIAQVMILRDNENRRMYRSLAEFASEIRVSAVVPVEVLEEYPDIVGILVNPVDYVLGADKGGSVAMFDDFDIDYNQHKYLIETRVSGALTKLKSAMVVKKTASANALVAPAAPTFNGTAVTVVNTTGVVYRNADTDAVINAAGSPYAVAEGTTYKVSATPAAGYYFATSDDDYWTFTNEA